MQTHIHILFSFTLLVLLPACSASPSLPLSQSPPDAGPDSCEAECTVLPPGPCNAYQAACGGPGPYVTAWSRGCPAECLQLYCKGRQELAPMTLGGEGGATCSTETPELEADDTLWCCL